MDHDIAAGKGASSRVAVTGGDEELIPGWSIVVDVNRKGDRAAMFAQLGRAGKVDVIAHKGPGSDFVGGERKAMGWIVVGEIVMSFFGRLLDL